MDAKVPFEEHQRFNQWWFLLLMAGINGMVLYGFAQQIIFDKPFGDRPSSDGTLIGITIGMLLLTYAMFSIRLDTRIDATGISYRFFPFHLSYQLIEWDRIKEASVRKYNPILEFGGWGLRYGAGNNRAVNISGNKGLQLRYDDHKKLLIGTNRESALRAALPGVKPKEIMA